MNKTEKNESIITKDKEFWETLSREAYPVTKGKLRIPISLEPFIVTDSEYTKLTRNLTFFISAARKIATKYFDDKEIQDIVVINEEERELIRKSKDQDFVGIVRVDLFYDQEPKIVEINADFPDGFFMHDVSSKTMLSQLNDKKLTNPNHAQAGFPRQCEGCHKVTSARWTMPGGTRSHLFTATTTARPASLA